MAQEAKATPLMSKDLTEFPGKEGLMITVEYPPGASDPVHRWSGPEKPLYYSSIGIVGLKAPEDQPRTIWERNRYTRLIKSAHPRARAQ